MPGRIAEVFAKGGVPGHGSPPDGIGPREIRELRTERCQDEERPTLVWSPPVRRADEMSRFVRERGRDVAPPRTAVLGVDSRSMTAQDRGPS
jgi:hypothetical protein